MNISILRGSVGRLLGAFMLLTTVVGGAGIFCLWRVARGLSEMAAENLQASVELSNAERALWNLRLALPNYVLADIKAREEISASTEKYIQQAKDNIQTYEGSLSRNEEERALINAWHQHFEDYVRARPHFFTLVDEGRLEEAKQHRALSTNPSAVQTVSALEQLIEIQKRLGNEREAEARFTVLMASLGMLALVLGSLAMGAWQGRKFMQAINTALLGLKRSSADLEAAALAYQSSARDLALAAGEISETLGELLVASNRIADASQGVAQIATETGTSAESGDEIAQGAGASLGLMREKVAEIVKSMGVLDQSSREIDSIVDIINELSQQTNILSINATIEAAGAGQAGLRFAIVADAIRHLADRVGASARGIRDLTSAVHAATAMTRNATDEGDKAVRGSSLQFTEVLERFREISGKVGLTTQATQEIDSSIQKQTTTVMQVHAAMAQVVYSAQETEGNAKEMAQSCAELRRIEDKLGELTGI